MAASMMLPTHQRYIKGVPVSTNRKSIRLREKYVIGVVFFTFTTVCFGAIFFLPEFKERVSGVGNIRRGIDEAGRELFFPRIGDGDSHKIQIKDQKNRTSLDDKLRAEIDKDKQKFIESVKLKEELARNATAQKNLEIRQAHEGVDLSDSSTDVLEKRQKIKEVMCCFYFHVLGKSNLMFS